MKTQTETQKLNELTGAANPIISMRDVISATTYSRPSLYRLIAAGNFPRPVKLGPNKIGFIAAEVAAWIEARPRANVVEKRAS